MTHIFYRSDLPSTARHRVSEGNLREVWCDLGDRYALLVAGTSATIRAERVDATIMDILETRGWSPIPADDLAQSSPEIELSDAWHIANSAIFEYTFAAPQSRIEGLRQFVSTTSRGEVPTSWAETAYTDAATGAEWVLCTMTASRSQARVLGAAQRSLQALSSPPSDVHTVQRVRALSGFSGWESISLLPTPRATQVYAPGEVYQMLSSTLGDRRGQVFTNEQMATELNLSL